MEEILVKHIENGIRAIRMGTKTPQEVNINIQLAKLNLLNEGLREDLQKQYVEAVKNIKK